MLASFHALATALQENGVNLLAIPERDDAGEYMQAYTRTFDEHFFEILERRGGYNGFGASNAQIRLTAQARDARRSGIPRR